MKKEIIVNADDLESRVAILENGQLAELHVEREARIVGSIYKARVESVLRGMDAAFADVGLDRNVFLCADDVGFVSRNGVTVSPAPRSASITQRLKEKQEVVVQIVRAPVAGKGARATTRLALPGRYLVLLLSHAAQVGVSRKIEERKERERLRQIGGRIRPKDAGLIIRTEAEGHNRKDLETDLKVLLDLRDRLMKKAAGTKGPAVLHQDLTLVYQVIRDVFTEDVERLVIDEKSAYDNAVELVKLIAPKLRQRIKLYRGRLPVFDKHGIEGEIDRLLRRKVWLDVGGYISIDQAEAFTAIDVNTGRYTGSTGLEDTILRTNMEAAEEIARQLRLRDLGGIIVIDFIDMERKRSRDRVVKAFEAALKRDRQRTKILHLSPLGLIEMTRKRRGESLMGILTEACPHCAGLGRVRRPLTIALKLEREASRLTVEDKVKAQVIRAAGGVATILVGDRGRRAAALEKRVGGPVYIRADHNLGIEEHELIPTTRAEVRGSVKVYNRGEEVVLDRVDPPEPGGDQDIYGWADGYRVFVESPPPVKPGSVIVLTEAGRSFGRGHVKGAKQQEQPPRPSEEGAAKPRRRRRPRRKSKAAAKTSQAAEASPNSVRPEAEPAKETASKKEAPRAAPPEAESRLEKARPKKQGLLQRGARRLKRALR
ncbi:MAG TPA: Rne/Rng family ribonuclease [Armatimonadota bacterium]|nr:Rne/Rng family ribonuclease [Armatimonadota bacterium]